ncbi:MAG TPA: hypothetical protein VGH28_31550 [Polyangiaceae bacterium]
MRRPLLAAALLLASSSAFAEDSILKQPGQHPDYFAELEVHGLVAYGGGPLLIGRYPLVGFGPGFHANFRILKNGFIPSLNDNVAIGVGAELVFDTDNAVHLVTPIFLQWNFWITKHWSVLGEPGVAIAFPLSTPRGPEPVFLTPALSVGARYNFNDHVTLLMRLGFPVSSVGVSFFL